MYGNNMGTLKVKLSSQVIFNKSEDQGNKWHMKQIGLTGKGARKVSASLSLFHGDMILRIDRKYV